MNENNVTWHRLRKVYFSVHVYYFILCDKIIDINGTYTFWHEAFGCDSLNQLNIKSWAVLLVNYRISLSSHKY